MASFNQIIDCKLADVETEPVELSEAKAFCLITISDQDSVLTSLITTARAMCEEYTGVSFFKREVVVTIDNTNGMTRLPFGPVPDAEITSIVDVDGTYITDYKLIGNLFPSLKTPTEIVTLTYDGGYETLPAQLKTGLLNAIYYLYENRAVATDSIGEVAKKILKPFRRV